MKTRKYIQVVEVGTHGNGWYDKLQVEETFKNALLVNQFREEANKEDVEFTCISGDVTTDFGEQENAFIDMRNIYSKNTPVYACRGK